MLRPLRPLQALAIDNLRQAIRERHRRIIIQAPTGFGKTITFTHIIQGALNKGNRALVCVPSISLVEQTYRSFQADGIRDIGIMQANHPLTDPLASLQIASIQTLIKRNLPDIDLIIIDEVHREWDGFNESLDGPWKDKIAIGMTATPWSKGLGLRWTKLIVAATIPQLISHGLLTPTVLYVPDESADRSALVVKQGEFTDASAAREMSQRRIVGNVVDTWKAYSTGEKTFMYCVNRDHAKAQREAFEDAGIPFGYIDAHVSVENRRREFEKMQYGDIAGISSVGCLIEGVDEDVRNIIMAKPTRSEIEHVQSSGRGIRTAPGKEHLRLFDHAGNNLALGLFWEIYHDHLDTHDPASRESAYEGEKRPPKPKKCPICKVLIEPGQLICLRCGNAIRATGVEHTDGDLIVYGTQPKKKAKREYSMEEKQQWFSGLLYLEIEGDRKSGSAANRYRAKFGVWPNQLQKIPQRPTVEVEAFDRLETRKYVESKRKQSRANQAASLQS